MKWRIVLVPLVGTIIASQAPAASMQGRGEHLFGPDTSENRACELAEQRAKKDAIQQTTGELVAADILMVCSEKQEEASCNLNRMTLSTINGVIRKARTVERKIVPGLGGYKKCVITLEADVVEGIGRHDPNFDMSIRMNNRTFRSGEPIEILVAPTAPMYVSVFQWLPYERRPQQVQKIFPNEFDPNNFFRQATTIPTKEGRSRYALKIGFPNDVRGLKERVDEYLIVVGTRKPVNFQSSYTLKRLNLLLLEIPRADQRVVRKGYYVAEQ